MKHARWQRIGTLTQRFAAKLKAQRQAEIGKESAPPHRGDTEGARCLSKGDMAAQGEGGTPDGERLPVGRGVDRPRVDDAGEPDIAQFVGI